MRGLMVLIACLAWLAACKGDDPASTPGTPGMPGAASPGRGDEVIRPGDDSAAGRALAALMAMEPPVMDAHSRCAEYAGNMRSFLAALGHELSRLRARGDSGVSAEVLARLGLWMEDRVPALQRPDAPEGERAPASAGASIQIDAPEGERAPASAGASIQTHELARLHRELVAAMRDLASAISAAYGASVAGPDSAEAGRVANAVANLRATFAALGALCAAP